MKRMPAILSCLLVLVLLVSSGCDDDSNSPPSTSKETYTLSGTDGDGIAIELTAGQTVKITTTGEVHANPGGVYAGCDEWTDADGLENCDYVASHPEIHGLPFMALIGEWNGDYFLVGTSYEKLFSANGTLTLQINDWQFDDNGGAFTVVVTIED